MKALQAFNGVYSGWLTTILYYWQILLDIVRYFQSTALTLVTSWSEEHPLVAVVLSGVVMLLWVLSSVAVVLSWVTTSSVWFSSTRLSPLKLSSRGRASELSESSNMSTTGCEWRTPATRWKESVGVLSTENGDHGTIDMPAICKRQNTHPT